MSEGPLYMRSGSLSRPVSFNILEGAPPLHLGMRHRAGSQVKDSESKSDLIYFALTIPAQVCMLFVVPRLHI